MFFAAVRNRLARVLLAALLIAAVVMPPWAPLLRPAHAAGVPELPRVYLNTTYALPTGPTITVPAGGDFQAALNSAQPNSVIVLTAGATYTGNFTLPNKSGAGWIYILSSALTSLPTPGTRVAPAQAPLMPKIVSSNTNPAIATAGGAHHYRFAGIELASTWASTSSAAYAVVNLDGSPAPANLVFDRCYIHGTPTGSLRNGVIINSASTAILDSWISDVHELSNEAHGILGNSGPGPFKLVNNEVQAAGQNIMFSQDSSNGVIPSDIEIRGNHLFKPTSWYYPNNPNAGLTTWSVKNLFELKNATRVLFDGNVLENAWNDYFQTNSGAGITLTPRAGCSCPWHVVADVTITHNIINRTTSGYTDMGTDNNGTTQPLQRVLLKDNLFLNIGAFPDVAWGMQGMFHYTSTPTGTGFSDVTIDHNTVLISHPNTFYSMYIFGGGSASFQNFVFTNNIALSGGGLNGNTLSTLNAFYPGYLFAKNAMIGGTDNPYPTGTFFPASYDPGVSFVNYAGGDYHLAPSSPFKNAGTDARDLGADIDALLAATASAVTGVDPTATTPTLSVTPSTSVDFGTVTVGGSADRSFTVTNTGGGTLTGTASSAAPFSVISGGSFSLGAGASQTAVARFSPTVAGSFAGTVTVNSNVGPASRSGTGTGTAMADTTPPVISSVTVSSIALTTAAIAWTTNEPADSQVEYGLTTAYGSSTSLNATLVNAHAVTLSGLAAGTLYHYRVKSKDAAGNLATSSDLTVTTVPAADTTPPAVALTAPTSGVTASGTGFAVSATATDNVGVLGVQFTLDGLNLGAEDTIAPYVISWNTTTASNGSHVLAAVARDRAGNRTTSAPVNVTVGNTGGIVPDTAPPVISSVAPSSVTSSGATITWTTDEAADSAVEYGTTMSYGSVTPLNPSMVTAHTVMLSGLAADTIQHYHVRSKDAAGNQTQSADFTFTTASATSDPPPSPDPGTSPPTTDPSPSQDPGTSPPPASSSQGSGTASGGGGSSGGSGLASGGGSPASSQTPGIAPGGTAPAQGADVASGGAAVAPGPGPASTWSAAVPAQTQGVVWSSLLNVTSIGSSLTKISGCDGCADAGAVSEQQITAGDGYVEFTASETSSLRLIGFRNGTPGVNKSEIRFAINLRPGGTAEVRELGMRRTNTTYARGDVFRIAVVAGTVRYYKNGRLLYISGLALTYPLTVGTSLMSRGATVTKAIISGRLSAAALPIDTMPPPVAFANVPS